MKKVFLSLLVFGILIFSASFFFPLLHSGLFISHDGINHVARLAAYFQAFLDGQIPPRFAGLLINHGYGSPALNFFYPLPGYVGSLFHALGLSFIDSFKLVLFLSVFGAGITFFLFIKAIYKRADLALASSIL